MKGSSFTDMYYLKPTDNCVSLLRVMRKGGLTWSLAIWFIRVNVHGREEIALDPTHITTMAFQAAEYRPVFPVGPVQVLGMNSYSEWMGQVFCRDFHPTE